MRRDDVRTSSGHDVESCPIRLVLLLGGTERLSESGRAEERAGGGRSSARGRFVHEPVCGIYLL